MSQVTQSPFLQALGYAIINSLWQFALLWLIYVSINTFLKLSSHQKYSAGLLIQVSGFTWFAATFSFYFQQFTKLEEIYFLQQKKFSLAFADSHTLPIGDKFFAGIMQTENFLPYLSIAYLSILFFLAVKWIRLYHITQAIKTKGLQKIDVKWCLFVKQLSNRLGIKHEVKIFLSEIVQTPLTIGFFKPLILIPLASLNHLNTYQMEAIILHELAHIKRFDYLFNLFLALIDITLFFNPFTALITKHIKRERENCCDDWVLQYEYNAASYATALLQIASYQSSPLLALQAVDNKHVLLNRIKRIIEKKENSFFNYRYQLMALFVMLTVASSLALLSSSHNIKKAAVSHLSKQIIVAQMAERVNSPLFNPDFFIAPDEEKGIKDNKFLTEKNTNNNFHFDALSDSRITVVTNNKTSKQKPYPKLLSVKGSPAVPHTPDAPAVPGIPDEPIAEDLIKNIETSNTGLEFPVAALEEQHVELEEQLKQLAIHLFEENKAAINQKEVLAEIKAAFDQIKKVKMQSELAKQKMPGRNQIRNHVRGNELRINSCFTPCDLDKLQWITKELQLKTEEFRKQADRATERISRYNNNYRVPKVIYRVPLKEKPHSFSFEFSTDPKVKVITPDFFYIPKKGKNINKKSLDGNNKSFKLESPSPFIPNMSLEKITAKEDNFLIIRI